MQFYAPISTEVNETVSFLGIDLDLTGCVLRPREETELLARAAIEKITQDQGAPLCIDMCCGAGNIAIALARHHQNARIWACDLTDDAVATSRHNVRRHDLIQRVAVLQGDLFAPLADAELSGAVDLIVANPPYISTSRLLGGDRAELLENEPREAFDGGPYGVSLHMRIIKEAPAFLRSGGWLGFEFGLGQDRQIAALLKRAKVFADPVWHHDGAGDARAVMVQKL
ncbi:N5-glutamine methyltransferase family protein [Hyphomicrobium sulfonivorans]|uniref:N5-glutamine methyltransferase family protein n=1 Tax=Hyphomicrobium sulfonivorans TaxID=121290 RepID=UPI00156D92BA|nr:class I SAM-dependent methyltransferase [Hyphomicrobium sulfonivorans]MBI1650901.1 class I SAM-dependent methyltransferase [Hyphomicrobium sulfonivorans]NSL72716.1 methyltransferase [Hyphomicrobium sulfonivorans]